MKETISYENFAKLDLRTAIIEKVEDIKGADKLYKLSLDLAGEKRTICAGIKKFYKKEELKGKIIIIVANLEQRKMRGILSEGMLLAAEGNKPILLTTFEKVESGLEIH